MSTHRPHRIDRATAERLLHRVAPGPQPGTDRLADLLAAAAAPAVPGELAGETAALAAFRTAQLTPVPRPRRFSMMKTALAKFLTVKFATVALTATATVGGVAVAAGTGTLPNPLSDDKPATQPGPHSSTVKPSVNPSGHDKDKDSDATKSDNTSPSPSLVGLCHAFTAGAGENPGKALDNPAFSFLITSAGGRDKVADYCVEELASAATKAQQEKDAKDKQAGAPTAHPSGPPATHPTGPPTKGPDH